MSSAPGRHAPHCLLKSWVCWSISADVTRRAEDLCKCIRGLVEANDEAGAFVWTVYEMANRRAPGAVFKYWAQGQGPQRGRDQFDVCAYGLAEISSTSAPTACRRSVLAVCLQLVGDRLVFLISIRSVCMSGLVVCVSCVQEWLGVFMSSRVVGCVGWIFLLSLSTF